MAGSESTFETLVSKALSAGVSIRGATDEEIVAAEKALGREFPWRLKALFRSSNGIPRSVIFDGAFGLMSLDDLVRCWTLSMELASEVQGDGDEPTHIGTEGAKSAYFLPDWFPIFDRGDSTFLAFDNDPADEGVAGQLVYVDPTDNFRPVCAPSIEAWLSEVDQEFPA